MTTASVSRRAFSFFIDHIFILSFGSISIFVFTNPLDENASFPSLGFYLIGVAMLLAYIIRDIIGGASLGKRFLGLKVINSEEAEKPVSAVKLGLRNLFILLWPLEFLVLIFNSQNRRIGDMVAKTQVSYDKNNVSTKFRLSIISILVAAFTISFFYITSNVRKTPSYRLVSEYVLNDQQIVNEIGEIKTLGKYPSLSIKSNDIESISMISFRVSGKSGTKNVRGFLRKTKDTEWKVEKVEYFD